MAEPIRKKSIHNRDNKEKKHTQQNTEKTMTACHILETPYSNYYFTTVDGVFSEGKKVCNFTFQETDLSTRPLPMLEIYMAYKNYSEDFSYELESIFQLFFEF